MRVTLLRFSVSLNFVLLLLFTIVWSKSTNCNTKQDRNLMFFGNIGMLLMSVFFVFGVAGVDLFGKLKRIYPINTNFNFENLPQAMLTLASASTTEGWIDIRTVLVSQGDRAWVPAVYFVLFMVIGCIVMLNVFAAVVVELLQVCQHIVFLCFFNCFKDNINITKKKKKKNRNKKPTQ